MLHPSKNLMLNNYTRWNIHRLPCIRPWKPSEERTSFVIGAGPIGLATLEFNRLDAALLVICPKNGSILSKALWNRFPIQFEGDGSEKEKILEATNGNLLISWLMPQEIRPRRVLQLCSSYSKVGLCRHYHRYNFLHSPHPSSTGNFPSCIKKCVAQRFPTNHQFNRKRND